LLYEYFIASSEDDDTDSVAMFLRFCCLTKNILLGLNWSGDDMQADVILLQTRGGQVKSKNASSPSQVKSSQVKSSQVKSSQVKSSQVKSDLIDLTWKDFSRT